MGKLFKIFLYISVSILIVITLSFLLVSIKASYGGLKLDFFESRINEKIKSSFLLNAKLQNILLKRENDKGFYIEIEKLEIIGQNDITVTTNLINWDFRLLNLLTLSIDKHNKISSHGSVISSSNYEIHIDKFETDYDESERIKISLGNANIKFLPSVLQINLIDSSLSFDTDSLSGLVKSKTHFKSLVSINNERYETELKYDPNKQQINIEKFINNNLYVNEKSFLKFDTKTKTAQIKIDINSKKNPILKSLNLDNESRIFKFINGFKGWQSIILDTNFRYDENFVFNNLIENLKLNISGIYELEALLPKDKVYSNFGNITNYKIDFHNEKERYVLNVNNIKNDQISLKKGSFFKINKLFDDANINLVTSIDKEASINFLRSTILSRESDMGRVVEFLKKNLNEKNDVILNFNINPASTDITKSLKDLYVISSGKFNSDFIFDDNENPNYILGPVNYYIEIQDLESPTPKLMGQIDLTEVNAYVRQINLKKNDNTSLKIKFDGVTNSLNDSLISFDSLDSDIDFKGKIKISKTNHIFLDKLSINNKSNVNLFVSGDLSERILNLQIEGNIIDLSKNKVETKNKNRNYYLKEENYSIITDKVIFAGSVEANDFKASIEKKGPKLSVNSRAIFEKHYLNYSREKSEYLDVNIVNSSDITYFINNDHPARKLLSDGEFKMTSIRNLNTQDAEVKIDLNDFVLINTPASLKLLSLPSISGLVSIAEGEQGIRFGYGEIKYKETEKKFSEIEAFAVSDSLGLIMEGHIDRIKKTIDMQGEISPMHLVNAIIQKLPILGPIIVGGEGEGMFSIDFTMTGSSDDPDVESSPLTIIKPRIIERAIEAFDYSSTIR